MTNIRIRNLLIFKNALRLTSLKYYSFVLLTCLVFNLEGMAKVKGSRKNFLIDFKKQPKMSELIPSEKYKKLLNDGEILKEVYVDAHLVDLSGSLEKEAKPKRYTLEAAFFAKNKMEVAKKAIMENRLYPKLIPYIDLSEFDKKLNVLTVEGGIWKYRLRSRVQFEEVTPSWIRFEIIEGHFLKLRGNVFFESAFSSTGKSGTLIYTNGEVVGNRWPPAFVVEEGAQIVFTLGGNKMRNVIEKEFDTYMQEILSAEATNLLTSEKKKAIPSVKAETPMELKLNQQGELKREKEQDVPKPRAKSIRAKW